MSEKQSWWARVKAAARWVRDAEPAMLQALWKGALGIAVLWGLSVPAGLDGKVTGTITAVYALMALWQGHATRARVYAPATVEARAAELSATRQVQVLVQGDTRHAGPYPPA